MLPRFESYDIVIIGGGFFGTYLGIELLRNRQALGLGTPRILILEREDCLLRRASLVNQARVHGGYHYPRSLVTGLRSQENYRRFIETFSDCIQDNFIQYYAISRNSSAVTAQQFKLFCERIGAPLSKAPPAIVREFNASMIEDVFVVKECAFDAVKLRDRVTQELVDCGIEVCTQTEATRVAKLGSADPLTITIRPYGATSSTQDITTGKLFICTYSCINEILSNSGLPQIPIRNEFTEMCLVRAPGFLEQAGVTVMCGPFFSIMPYPSKNLHSLSHVRYTPHFAWEENDTIGPSRTVAKLPNTVKSHYLHMKNDAQRYLPLLQDLEYCESIWENKTLLPRNELDDARPILLKEDHGLPNLTCIIGAKIDNVFDVCRALNI